MRSVKQQPLFQKSVFFLVKHCFAFGAKIFTHGFTVKCLYWAICLQGKMSKGRNVVARHFVGQN